MSVCIPIDGGHVCVETEREIKRTPDGERWCFHCRHRRAFEYVVSAPTDPMSYYGPSQAIYCTVCNGYDADLFPGRSREWGDV